MLDTSGESAFRRVAAAFAGAGGRDAETLRVVADVLQDCSGADRVEIWQREHDQLHRIACGTSSDHVRSADGHSSDSRSLEPRASLRATNDAWLIITPTDEPHWFAALETTEPARIEDPLTGATTLLVPTIPIASADATGLLVIGCSRGQAFIDNELTAARLVGELIATYTQGLTPLAAAVDSSPTAITVRCRNGFLLDCNQAFLDLVGRTRDELVGSSLVEVVDLAEAHRVGVDWGGSHDCSLDVPYLHSDGRTVWGRTSTGHSQRGAENFTISHIHDITEARIEEIRLSYEASHDELTGLRNRRALMESLKVPLDTDVPVTLLLLDLDGFKVTNDSLGHDVGDQLLRVVAQRLLRVVRPQDLVARLGGDEFVLVLQRADRAEGIAVAERVLEVLRQPARLGGTEVFTGASIGIATATSDDDRSSAALLRAADIAMYAAKSQGKNCFEVFDASHKAAAAARRAIETDLRRAVRSQNLEVYYQPILELDSGALCGAEALVRWRGAGDALIDAAKFADVASEVGVLAELGAAALEAACLAGTRWTQDDKASGFSLRVNVALAQLSSRGLVPLVDRVLGCTDFPAQSLCLEISESALMSDPDRATDALNALHDLGVKLCVDSFGQGLGSILQLRRFPIDMLKIAPEIVWGVDEDPDYLSIAEMIMLLANSMNLEVVADGIETDAQREAMHALGVSQGQGYHLQPPMSAEDLTDLIHLHYANDTESPSSSDSGTFAPAESLDLRDRNFSR